jgi:hypothetical protein
VRLAAGGDDEKSIECGQCTAQRASKRMGKPAASQSRMWRGRHQDRWLVATLLASTTPLLQHCAAHSCELMVLVLVSVVQGHVPA